MHHIARVEDAMKMQRDIEKAVEHKLPVTITYLRDAQYCAKQEYDTQTTIRTVEPYAIEITKKGHGLIRALDRDTHKPRSIREDRIVAYTLHTRGKRLEDHQEESNG